MNRLTLFVLFLSFISCNHSSENVRIIGEKIIVRKNNSGVEYYDTLSATPPDFCFLNQLGDSVCTSSFEDKIWVCDFFFTHCPSICVKMERNLLRVHSVFENDSQVHLVSISIDPKRDSITALKQYAQKLGVLNSQWDFLTGNKDSIYHIADLFLANASEDPNSPGGYIHDGNFILVDRKGRIRGFYNGIEDKAVDQMIEDIKKIIHE